MKVTPEQREAWAENTAHSPFNRWLDSQFRGPAGQLDIDKLHSVALQFGIDRRAQYAHLNPGQQRMNIGNLLRRIVPKNAYAGAGSTLVTEIKPKLDATRSNRRDEVRAASVRDLLAMYGQIMDELKDRDVVRTSNSPGGDYAEKLFSDAFGWELLGKSAKEKDAVDANGLRYQIKSRRITPANGSRQLGALRKLPEGHFDYLAGVLFASDFSVLKAAIIPHAIVVERSRLYGHTNAWIFFLDDAVWTLPGVRDVTNEIAAVAAGI